MKQIFTNAAHLPAYEPKTEYLNLYIDKGDAVGMGQSSLEMARSARSGGSGVTLRIKRDAQGDFTIEKVEEF